MNRLTTRPLLAALALSLLATSALAERTVVKEYKFDLKDIHEVELHGAVGALHVIHSDRPQAAVVLEIKQQHRGWFSHDIDLDEVELNDRVRGDRLVLEQQDDDLNIVWTVELPTVARTTLDLGVGEIDGEFGDTEVFAKIGVGEIRLRVPEARAGDVQLDTGVGDARLIGGERQHEKRSMVTKKVHGHGSGDKRITGKVGVGDVTVRLTTPKA